jgi:hypothetical protein
MSARNPQEERTIGSVEDSNSFKLSFLPEGKFKKLYLHDEQANIDVIVGGRYELVDEDGPGQIVAFEVATDNTDLVMECFVYGDNISVKRIINAFTMNELLRLGRGLTPGEVEINPDLRSKDPPGIKDDQYPWLSRWKIDTGPDATGSTQKYIVCRFTPTVYQPYRRIIVNLYNSSQTDVAHIHTLSLTRFFFERVPSESERPPKSGTQETYQVYKDITPDTEYPDDALDYSFKQPPPNELSSDEISQPQESVDYQDVDEF